jgi:hypothetical protein
MLGRRLDTVVPKAAGWQTLAFAFIGFGVTFNNHSPLDRHKARRVPNAPTCRNRLYLQAHLTHVALR